MRRLLYALCLPLAVVLVVQLARLGAPAPPPEEPEAVSPFFPAYRATRAVVAFLEGRESLEAATAACVEGRRRSPDNVFGSFLLAFCRAQAGDAAGEAAVLQEDCPDARYVYDFLFREQRQVLPEALRQLAPFKCWCQRQELGDLDKPPLCPVDGTPYVPAGAGWACAACDAVFDADRMPALMPVYEQATQDVLSRDRIARWGGARLTAGELFHRLGFRPGQAIADIGCGLGAFVFPFAREAGPAGRVYAEEIEPGFLEVIRHGREATGLSNVEPVLGDLDDVGVAAGTLDRILLCEVYKSATINTGGADPAEFEKSVAAFFGSLRRALKADGQLVIVNKRNPELGMAADPIRMRLEPLGFRLVRTLDDFPREDVLFFEKEP